MLIVNVTSRSEVGEVNELAMSSANYARIDQSTPNPRLIVYSVKTKILFVRGWIRSHDDDHLEIY